MNIVMAIREAFDQLHFSFQHGVGRRVWVPWQEDPLEGATGWTTAVNTTLCRIDRSFDVGMGADPRKVMPGAHLDYGEWLWDITWCRENEGRITDLPLVAECEWGQTVAEIVEDFQKLLVARAGVRLMIHEHWWDRREEIPNPPAMANHLAQHVKAFGCTQPDDAYLLVALDGHGQGEEYQYHRMRYFRLRADGVAVEWAQGEPPPFAANEP